MSKFARIVELRRRLEECKDAVRQSEDKYFCVQMEHAVCLAHLELEAAVTNDNPEFVFRFKKRSQYLTIG